MQCWLGLEAEQDELDKLDDALANVQAQTVKYKQLIDEARAAGRSK